MTRLWLARHGHTVWHDTGGVAGRTDVELSDTGRDAASALKPSLEALRTRAHRDARDVHAWLSPMTRTRQTAALCGLIGGAEDARLVELDFGDWEGMTWSQVHSDYGELLSAWADDWVGGAPPGGESFADQLARCSAWCSDALEQSGDHVVIAHGGTIRALLSLLLGHPPQEAMRFRIDPACVCRLDRGAQGWHLRAANVAAFT